MAKAKRAAGRKKGKKTVRGKRGSTSAKKKAGGAKKKAASKRRRAATPGIASPAPAATPIAVPGAWPFPMLSKP